MARPRRTAQPQPAPDPVRPPPEYSATPEPEATDALPVFLDYDTWVNGERVAADPVVAVMLPRDRAKQLLAEGKARRADPLPGE